MAHQDHKAYKATLVLRENLDHRAYRATLEHLAPKAILVNQGHKAYKVI